jgi:hypothetical protein
MANRYLGREIKCALNKTLVRFILTYGGESWPLKRKDENMFRIFERRILRRMYGPIKGNVCGDQGITMNISNYIATCILVTRQ